MAGNTNAVVINNFKATGYNADVEVTKNGYVITGRIGMDGDKRIIKFDGSASKENVKVCSFNSYLYAPAGGISYNLTDVRDVEKAAGALIAIGAAEADIQAEALKEN